MRGDQRFWLWFLVAVASFVVFIILFAPQLDVNGRQARNESITVSRFRRLNKLQRNYSAAYLARGFSCELAQLKPNKSDDHTYDPNQFLLTGVQSGYKFAVTGCRPNPDGAVTQYQVTAIPLEPGKTGFAAFCMNQTGSIWYDRSGSAENCLVSRRPLK
jgi:hypothetical protein